MVRRLLVVLYVLGIVTLGVEFLLAAPLYDLTDLTQGRAYAINASGQVVGSAYPDGVDHAFLYTNGSITNLGGTFSQATAINVNGQVAGVIVLDAGGTVKTAHAFTYRDGTVTDLGTFGGYWVHANGINGDGQVVISTMTSGSSQRSFLFNSGTTTDLSAYVGGNSISALAINDAAQVVGYAYNPWRAFLYCNGSMTSLGTLPGGSSSFADCINTSGEAAGQSYAANGHYYAVRYRSGAITSLGTLLGGSNSTAEGINDIGQVVGESDTASGAWHAFLYSDGTMMDLNDLAQMPAGWTLEAARGINNSGWIVGWGNNAAGQTHAFLLTPIPEPSMAGLIVSGLVAALLAAATKRFSLTQTQLFSSLDAMFYPLEPGD
jgi:probable HAF family extracellular repeat protein